MGYRKQPLGYSMQLGEIIVAPEEAELVQHIFQRYASGASYRELTEELKHQAISYQEGKMWNKCMVARILEDTRYLGEYGYPRIIEQEMFNRAAAQRSSQQRPSNMTEAERLLKQLCRHEIDRNIVNQVLGALNALAEDPDQIQTEEQGSMVDAILLRRELDELLVQIPVDEGRSNSLIRKYATTLYDSCNSLEYETERLQRIFAMATTPMQTLDAQLLRTTVATVIVKGNAVKAMILKNLQSIEVN